MTDKKRFLKAGALAGALLLNSTLPAHSQIDYQSWLENFRQKAAQSGISKKTLDGTLTGLTPNKRVLELDRRQPEFSLTFWKYLNNSISDKRIKRGRELLKKHAGLFKKVHEKYGVQPRFLVAFWGLETNFGDYTGVFPLIQSLTTLAHDERRREFFTKQLITALEVMDRGDIPYDVKASWAGAMGYCQFMPTTYKAYAVDGDGDNKRDMWNSLPDVFYSAANFLSQSGWQPGETWGREVKIPKNLNLDLTGLGTKKQIGDWAKLGILNIDGKALPKADIKASLILPSGYKGPAFLVYENFRTILDWNRSNFYAIAVGHLADRLVWKGPLQSPQRKETPLSRAQTLKIQARLNALGYDVGKPDGIAGSRTRKGIKAFQKKNNIPADGYPNAELLGLLK
ncbi:Lytic murein transglycosylase [Candidatus Terasakiella magnetica]|uniref:Lytic murein transglycosylase n=1 Tax=Candidatus Terasakiella magnetica TaxID=1867952 RepID=A0A1C3RD59_9PROT|nr:lytic murein transglycosylase [Candidatus Terasakiella magnetica]SCA55188.1 Lytic murein transglycosylase [Candidatus Terasakiella magnetica]